MRKLEMRAKT